MLDLIEYLLTFATGPIALVCAARSEVLEARTGLTAAWTIELEQLTDSETDVLVAALGVEDAALRAQIAATADGNPLFAEQLAGSSRRDPGYVVTRRRPAAGVDQRPPGGEARRAGHPGAPDTRARGRRRAGVLAARGGGSRDQRRSPVSREPRSSRWRARD